MATRATAADVLGILDTTYTDTTVLPFLTSANVIVTANLGDKGLSDEILAEIERWLAAHFVSLTDPATTDRDTDGISRAFERAPMGKGLLATRYGQQVLLMDSTGTFRDMTRDVGSSLLFLASSPDSTGCE